ncbi:predicted protein [Naegleria gruberi]|uniref:Predicted protein n=1 Tax=Naegleria gruberi TaxID=5762 RepID=D2V5W0_NAEGR|nr:uncharacterized protein NAEGRDRAFT_64220 [Naegleria gruberi]EFC47720.1 predicted protein [Naegleria gruberi]|eukprot:XP_002680464.1 predicted protein [Naegleria gruberi strain NEG-M]
MSTEQAPQNLTASPLASTDSTINSNTTASGIPFIKSRGRTVPKPFNLSSTKKRDISQVSNSSEGKKNVDQSSKKLKSTLSKTNSGVPFIKKKDATVCEPPKFLTSKREVQKKPIQKKAEKTPFTVEEDFVENVMREVYAQNFKKDVSADIEKVKVPVDVLITRLNNKLEECKNTYLFNVQSIDLSTLKNFCRQHSKKFEIAQDKEKNQKVVRLKKPNVLKTVNTIINKPLKSVLIASIKNNNTTHSTPTQEIIILQEVSELCEKQVEEPSKQNEEENQQTELVETVQLVEEVSVTEPVEEVNMIESVESVNKEEPISETIPEETAITV